MGGLVVKVNSGISGSQWEVWLALAAFTLVPMGPWMEPGRNFLVTWGFFFNCTVFEIVCESPRGGHMLLDFILARLVHLKVAFVTLGVRAVAARG